jgi:tetratricopeptide (TPR) repeat protein
MISACTQPASQKPTFQGLTYVLMGLVLAIIALIYWPVIHADFVWDDVADFVKNNWLTHGDDWKHYILRDFNSWTNYFRPLIVAFFTLQLRLFDVTPGPMHAVSLILHLANTSLVGLLAREACKAAGRSARQTLAWTVFCMAFYGLHPVLIEAVAWIGCQFDLVATLFMLLGLLAQAWIRSAAARAFAVASCFLLAAGCKESAAVFPLLLAIVDWALFSRARTDGLRFSIVAFIRRNWLAYLAMLVAGIAYLAVRHWALGQFIGALENAPQSFIGHVQEVAFLYLHYWKTLFWPTSGMGPMHPMDAHRFDDVSTASILATIAGLGLAMSGFYLGLCRVSPLGCIVTAMTVALLPVLHITSTAFDTSLYHERYVITGLAVCCTLLPLLRLQSLAVPPLSRHGCLLLGAAALAWFGFSLVAIRTTIPLWSNQVTLWRWALIVSPDSIDAKSNLLAAYVEVHNKTGAHQLADELLAEHTQCIDCLLNIIALYISDNKPNLATPLLEQIRNLHQVAIDKSLYHRYLLATGQVLLQQGEAADAEPLLRESTNLDPNDPQSLFTLSSALITLGKTEEARQVIETAIPLLPPNQQAKARKDMARLLERDPHTLPQSSTPPETLSVNGMKP